MGVAIDSHPKIDIAASIESEEIKISTTPNAETGLSQAIRKSAKNNRLILSLFPISLPFV
ncbi:MAG: hypothetical protein HY695_12520 [Deltaproteobacteria bacterium]|nr:hypothetical protein [Deltaproteobacteria bacterium]